MCFGKEHWSASAPANDDRSLLPQGQRGQNAPSGIAQLRKSSEQANRKEDDHMNLDEFIVPTSIASPAGMSPAPAGITDESISSSSANASAIPIRQQQRLQDEALHLSRASAPTVAPVVQNRGEEEFGYVQKHLRKTSIDERRVRIFGKPTNWLLANGRSLQNDGRKPLRKCLRSTTCTRCRETWSMRRRCTHTPWIQVPNQ